MNKILLTGATGFLGAFILDELLVNGYEVTIVKRYNSDLSRIQKYLDKIKIFEIKKLPLASIFEQTSFDSVVHLACCYGRNYESDIEIINSNILFGLELVENAIKYNVSTFVNASSFLVDRPLGNHPLKPYILSKKQFSQWLNYYSNQIKVLNLKIEHVFGPNDSKSKFVPWLISQIKSGYFPISLNQGEELRDFIHVSDVANAFLFLLKQKLKDKQFHDFNIGSGTFLQIKEFVKLAEEINSELKSKNTIPYKLKRTNVLQKGKRGNTKINQLKELGWHPNCTIEQGILELLN